MAQRFSLMENLEDLLPIAFGEDLPDITTEAVCDLNQMGTGKIIAKAQGIVCGLPFLPYIFQHRLSAVNVSPFMKDGDLVTPGDEVVVLEGLLRGILSAERVALNFLQHLSGIATYTRKFVTLLKGTPVILLDTRKTTPGWRYLEKYAVRIGGGTNHRLSAADAYMIKTNHVLAAGGIGEAVKKVLEHRKNRDISIILEVRSLEELREALQYPQVSQIMLDNFDPSAIQRAVELVQGKVPLEVSGGITIDNIRQFAATGIQYISVGALTHSAPALDFSLVIKPE